VPATGIGEIMHERPHITPILPYDWRRSFNTNPEFWLPLQNSFDLEIEKRSGTAVGIERHAHPCGRRGFLTTKERAERKFVHYLSLFSYNEHRLIVNKAWVKVKVEFPLKGKNRRVVENGAARGRNGTLAERD